jgi:hypothetical protein
MKSPAFHHNYSCHVHYDSFPSKLDEKVDEEGRRQKQLKIGGKIPQKNDSLKKYQIGSFMSLFLD